MRARRVDVGARLACDTRGLTTLEQSEAVISIRYSVLALSFDEYAGVFILANVQWSLTITIL